MEKPKHQLRGVSEIIQRRTLDDRRIAIEESMKQRLDSWGFIEDPSLRLNIGSATSNSK
jgi:hypothetical protein